MAFDKNSLHRLLTNIAYVGKLRYKTEIHAGEHAAIVDEAIWQRTQALLARNGRTGGAAVRNKFGALLKGILRCVPCGCAMVPSHATRNGTKRNRYYVCSGAQKRGWHACPSKSIPAGEVERFVVEQIQCVGRDPRLLHQTIDRAREHGRARVAELEAERRGLEAELRRWNSEIRELTGQAASGSMLADLHERSRTAEQRSTQIREQVVALSRQIVDEREIAMALSGFAPVWEALTPREQTRVVQLLVERVDYDGSNGRIGRTIARRAVCRDRRYGSERAALEHPRRG